MPLKALDHNAKNNYTSKLKYNTKFHDNMIESFIIYLTDLTIQQYSFQQLLTMLSANALNPNVITSSIKSSADRSSSKKFYDAVYKIIDHDQSFESITPFQQDHGQMNNGNKVLYMLENSVFVSHLLRKIQSQGYFETYPILKVNCKFNGFISEVCKLQKTDLQYVFQRFGMLDRVILSQDSKDAYILFKNYCHAYVAFKILDGLYLPKQHLNLNVKWLNNMQYSQISFMKQYQQYVQNFSVQQFDQTEAFQQKICIPKQNKLTCRYEIQIQNEKDFQVARRIIGTKGCNMKKIIELALQLGYQQNYPSQNSANELLKLRLRGKGSGYKQGPEQMQSQDNLHLCVSAKDQKVYQIACQNVENLLQQVYQDYQQYTGRFGKSIHLSLRKIDISNNTLVTPSSSILLQNSQNQQQRISPNRISQLLQLRNKARRQLNFIEADRIRNYLRNNGVCLIDEKGRRGKATDVTTWKYIF